MMKAIQFIPDLLQLLKKLSCQSTSQFGFFAQIIQRPQNQRLFSSLIKMSQNLNNLQLKGTVIYLSKAFGEGLKQNFLGPNVNIEFATLTVRVYGLTFVRLIAHSPFFNHLKFFVK